MKKLGAGDIADAVTRKNAGHSRGRCGSYLGDACGQPCQGRMTKDEYVESERENYRERTAIRCGEEVIYHGDPRYASLMYQMTGTLTGSKADDAAYWEMRSQDVGGTD